MKESANKSEFIRAMDYAHKLLASTQKTSGEIESRLHKKSFSEETIEEVIEGLKKQKYLNDSEFSMDFIEKKITGGSGRRSVEFGLQKKGISGDDARKYVNEYFSEHDVDECEVARGALAKKMKVYGGEDRKKISGKIRVFLTGRGFSADTIAVIMEEQESK